MIKNFQSVLGSCLGPGILLVPVVPLFVIFECRKLHDILLLIPFLNSTTRFIVVVLVVGSVRAVSLARKPHSQVLRKMCQIR
jgi:hypothetical protein